MLTSTLILLTSLAVSFVAIQSVAVQPMEDVPTVGRQQTHASQAPSQVFFHRGSGRCAKLPCR